MDLAIKVFVLSLLIRLLARTDNPWLCAIIYSVLVFVLGVVFGPGILSASISAALGLVGAFVYFSILNRLDTRSIGWWLVAVLGIPIVFL